VRDVVEHRGRVLTMKDITSDGPVAEQVLIPGGVFLVGADSEGGHGPPHRVRLDAYTIDKYEVTNAQYLRFCQETDHHLPEFWERSRFRCVGDVV
jgi:formylglycine-generating enzyme required for sulfatase activity